MLVLALLSTSNAIGCNSSDALLLAAQAKVCASFGKTHFPYCPWNSSNDVNHDFPHQCSYMSEVWNALLKTTGRSVCVASSFLSFALNPAQGECIKSDTTRNILGWLNNTMSDEVRKGTFATALVFQFPYYDMPYAPGHRIETPYTLGLKVTRSVLFC